MTNDNKVGVFIKGLREHLSVDQETFGKLIRPDKPRSQPTISLYESDGLMPGRKTWRGIVKLAKAKSYPITVDYLGEDDD